MEALGSLTVAKEESRSALRHFSLWRPYVVTPGPRACPCQHVHVSMSMAACPCQHVHGGALRVQPVPAD